MVKPVAIWFMEGVSSQKDILSLVKQARSQGGYQFRLIASHRQERPEILAEADDAWLEPAQPGDLLAWIKKVCEKYHVSAIHAGKRGALLESLRPEIEQLGVKLSTGACDSETFELADNKARFSQYMADCGLASVPSRQVQSADEIAAAIAEYESQGELPCIKPVRGIYGQGFWVLKRSADLLSFFNDPNRRQLHPEVAITALRQAGAAGQPLPLQIVMPYLPGEERSVDMLVERGRVIAAVARNKQGAIQTLENSGPAYRLAIACAEHLKADGLINVQTRNNARGQPVLLEANLRPSGGIGYTAFSGVNLPGLFALRQLGLISEAQTAEQLARFTSIRVIPGNEVRPLPVCSLSTFDHISDKDEG